MIDSFRGAHRFLSNFSPAPVWLDGIEYPTVEHAYQAAKTVDEKWRNEIRLATTPAEAKRLGRQCPMRRDFDSIEVMRDLLEQKFKSGIRRALLIGTGAHILVEGNTWGDTFWGMCNGKGENMLGILLMEVRQKIVDGAL